MKLLFNFEGTMKEFYFEKCITFHGNIDSQNNLYDTLIDGLSGSDKTFLLNNQPIKKKELNIVEFSMNSIFDDLKMTSKSYNLKIIQDLIADDNENLLDEINETLANYQSKIQACYQGVVNDESYSLLPSIKVMDVKKIILDNFTLLNKEDINISREIELELLIVLNYITMKNDQHFYLVIKHFDFCIDISQMISLLKKMEVILNLTVFIFSKSFELFEFQLTNKYEAFFIDKNVIRHASFINNIGSVDCEDLLTEHELAMIRDSLDLMERYKYYQFLISENKKTVEFLYNTREKT